MIYCSRRTSVDDYFLAIRVKSCWGGKVDNCANDFLRPKCGMSGIISYGWQHPYFPALPAGTGITETPISSTISAFSMVDWVISDGKTPGAIAFTVLK